MYVYRPKLFWYSCCSYTLINVPVSKFLGSIVVLSSGVVVSSNSGVVVKGAGVGVMMVVVGAGVVVVVVVVVVIGSGVVAKM